MGVILEGCCPTTRRSGGTVGERSPLLRGQTGRDCAGVTELPLLSHIGDDIHQSPTLADHTQLGIPEADLDADFVAFREELKQLFLRPEVGDRGVAARVRLKELFCESFDSRRITFCFAISKRWHELYPEDSLAYYHEARAIARYWRLGDWESLALDAINTAIRMKPDDASYLSVRSELYLFVLRRTNDAVADTTRAIDLMEQLDRTGRMDEDTKSLLCKTYSLRGMAQFALKKYHLAVRDFSRTIEMQPYESHKALGDRANAYFMLGKYRLAIEDCTKSIEIEPSSAVLKTRAKMRMKLRMWQLALHDVEEALKIVPDDLPNERMDGISLRSKALMQLGRLEEAMDAWNANFKHLVVDVPIPETPTEDNQIFAVPFQDRYEIYSRMGKLAEAEADLDTAIRFCSQHAGLRYARARLCWETGRDAEAEESLAEFERLSRLQVRSDDRPLAENVLLEEKLIDSSEIHIDPDFPTLGRGQFGVVRKATYDSKDVAVKKMFLGGQKIRVDLRQDFLHEVAMASRAQHPNVVRVYGSSFLQYEEDEEPIGCLIMEYCSGGDLRKWYPQSHPIEERRKILFQVALGMESLHFQGFCHRDLKPENVLLTEAGDAKICDFGFTMPVAGVSSDDIRGTPGYIPPPSDHMEPDVRKADVFAFGVLGFEILSGQRAFAELFRRGSKRSVCVILWKEKLRPSWKGFEEQVPEKIRSLLCRCWAENESDRPLFPEIVDVLRSMEDFTAPDEEENEGEEDSKLRNMPTMLKESLKGSRNDWNKLCELHSYALHVRENVLHALGISAFMVENFPDRAEGFREYASDALRLDKFELAVEALKKATQLTPNEPELWFVLADICVKRLDLIEEALEPVAKAIEVSVVPDSRHYFLRGRILKQLKRFEDAIPDLSRGFELSEDPEEKEFALCERVACFEATKQFDLAAEDYSRLIAFPNPPNVTLARRYYRGCAYFESQQYEEALPDLDHAIAHSEHPAMVKDARILRIQSFCQLGRFEDCLEHLEHLMQDDESFGGVDQVLSMKAYLLLVLERMEEALKTQASVIEASESPTAEAFSLRGRIHRKMGNLELASKDFSECLQLEPTQAGYHFVRGHVMNEMGMGDDADTAFRECVRHFLVELTTPRLDSTEESEITPPAIEASSFESAGTDAGPVMYRVSVDETVSVVLKGCRIETPALRRAFLHRVDRFSKCRPHPNILRVFGYVLSEFDKTLASLVVEACASSCVPLSKWIRGDHSMSERISLVTHLAYGLGHLHANRVFFRQRLRSKNVMVTETNSVKILCCTTFEAAEEEEEEGVLNGRFIPPPTELKIPETPTVLSSYDAYSFSILAYEILTGQLAFGDDTLRQEAGTFDTATALSVHVHRNLVRPSWEGFEDSVPLSLRTLLARCWYVPSLHARKAAEPAFPEIITVIKGVQV